MLPYLSFSNLHQNKQRLSQVFLTVILIGICISTIYAVFLSYPTLIDSDQWEKITIHDYINHFWAVHNEHRMSAIWPFFMIDIGLFHGTNIFNIIAIFLIQSIHAFFLTMLLWRVMKVGEKPQFISLIFIVASLFSLTQTLNLIWGFQICFVLVWMAATAALYILTFYGSHKWGMPAAIILSFISACSLANGLLAPYLLVSLAVFLKWPWRKIILLGLSAIIITTVYMKGYPMPAHKADVHYFTQNAGNLFIFLLNYLGSPFRDIGGTYLGAVGLLLTAGLTFYMLYNPEIAKPARWVSLHIFWFIIGSGIITAIGRIDLGVNQAFVTRYATPALIFWPLLLGQILQLCREKEKRAAERIFKILTFILLIALAGFQIKGIKKATKVGQEHSVAAMALLSDVWDENALTKIYPSIPKLQEKVPVLRSQELSIFHEEWASWRGTPLEQHMKLVSSDQCKGALLSVAPVAEQQWRLTGWAWDRQSGKVPDRLLFTDADGKVVGYGTSQIKKEIMEANKKDWIGFARIQDTKKLKFYMLLPDKQRACPFGSESD